MADGNPPSLAAASIAAGLLGLLTGYFIGRGASIGVFGASAPSRPSKSWPNSYDVTVHADSSDEDAENRHGHENENDSDSDGDRTELAVFDNLGDEVKLVLVVRTDLGMGKGKIAAQCGHATLACYKYLLSHPPSAPLLRRWENGGQAKVAVQAKTEEELEVLQARAISMGLAARVIHDAGRTQIAAGSATVLGVLGPKSVVDQVTGHLKLL